MTETPDANLSVPRTHEPLDQFKHAIALLLDESLSNDARTLVLAF